MREDKKEVDNDLEAIQRISKAATRKMFAELTKGQNMHHPSITPEQIAQAVTKSVSGMNGVNQEALNQFGQAFQALLESTLTPPTAKKKDEAPNK